MDFMNRPKKINLSNYGLQEGTLAEFISGSVSKTTRQVILAGCAGLFKDINTNRPLQIECFIGEYNFMFSGVSKLYSSTGHILGLTFVLTGFDISKNRVISANINIIDVGSFSVDGETSPYAGCAMLAISGEGTDLVFSEMEIKTEGTPLS